MKDFIICCASMQEGDTLSVPVDGPASVTATHDKGVVISFEATGRSSVFLYGEMIYDKTKRPYNESAELWYLTAVARCGDVLANGETVKDVISKSRMLLSSGRWVHSEYTGARSVSKMVEDRAAYLKHRLIKGKRCPEWDDFTTFQQWFLKHRPVEGKRWALRSPLGYFSPETCGFDRRTDLGLEGAICLDGLITRAT